MAASSQPPWILGYSASHNGAVCLLHGDEIVVAVQEERLRGEKRARIARLDESLAVAYCLDFAGIKATELSAIVGCYFSGGSTEGATITPEGWPGRYLTIPHHLGHAIAAVAQSGFDDATVLVVDGQGGEAGWLPESETAEVKQAVVPGARESNEIISIYEFDGARRRCVEKHLGQWIVDASNLGQSRSLEQFGSLGGMFSAASAFTFGNPMDAGKIMGLAAFGEAVHPPSDFYSIGSDGRFRFYDTLPARYRGLQPWPENQELHRNLAASTQAALEQAMIHLVRCARDRTKSRNLCLVGGVALNNVANELIVQMAEFDRVFIMPAAEDSGPAIGAAYFGLQEINGKPPRRKIVVDAPGRRYDSASIERAATRIPCIRERASVDMIDEVVEMLCQGKVLGWFQSGSELGPRALGQRSIIADPRPVEAKNNLNLKVKHREAFRPFAPAILEERVDEWFHAPEKDPTSPFMLRTFQFRKDKAMQVPAVVHHDGTGRLQTLTAARNGRFHDLVTRFEARTGVPILVNTSFNVMGEPIVETPEDALFSLLYTSLDAVVLNDRIFQRADEFIDLFGLYPGVTATGIRLECPLQGRFDMEVGTSSSIRALVRSPWGQAAYRVPVEVVPLLARIDGRKNGHELWSQLLQANQWRRSEFEFRDTLRHLRRTGVIEFRQHPWAPDKEPQH